MNKNKLFFYLKMKTKKNKNYQNQYLLNKNKSQNSNNIISPTRDEYFFTDQNTKDEDYLPWIKNSGNLFGNNVNSFKYMTPLNNFNNDYPSPIINDGYKNNIYIGPKYNDLSYNYEYQKYLEDDYNMKYDNENGNEKLHQIKDEYIEYLQKQLDENNKKLIKLETKSNEFQKRYKNLIEDNKLLNETLNERTSKLNEIIQENENLRLQLNNNIENENKIKTYYEKKISTYETNINECNKIINDLKERNGKSNENNNLNANKNEENNNESNNFLNINESNEEELQLIKNQNNIYLNNIKSKENTIELMTKENEKLMNENRIYRSQVEQYTQQITNLYNTIKQKNKIINIFKIKEGIIDNSSDFELEKKLEGMKASLSQENIHYMSNIFNNKDLLFDTSKDELMNSNTFNLGNKKNSDKINQSIDKLITDNEENKMKIELLNNKIKSLDQIEKKYFEFMKNNNIKQNDKDIIIENKKEIDINKFESNLKKEKMRKEEEKNMEYSNENEDEINDLKSYKKYIRKEIDKIEENKENEELSKEENIKKENEEISRKEEDEKLEKEKKEREEKEERERKEKEEKERLEGEERERLEREEKEERERKEKEEKERQEKEERERKEREKKEKEEREERERKEKEEKEKREREEKEKREKEENERKEKERKEKEELERKQKEEKEKKEREEKENSRRGYFRRRRMFLEKKDEENKKKEEDKKEEENKKKEEEKKEENKKSHGMESKEKDEKEEIKETVREMNRKKNYTHVPKNKKKFKISDELDVTEINTASPVVQQNLSFSIDEINSNINQLYSHIFLFGIDRNDNFHIFDLKSKKWSKRKILEIEDISDTFQKDYQYEGTILYNTLNGIFILTGQKLDVLYFYNSQNETINKICKFKNSHDNGSLMLDKENNRLFAFGGKNTTSCEYYSFNDKKVNSLPDLIIDRANASFVVCNGKIYGLFGFSYNKNNYAGSIEYIDYKKLDKWYEVKNINYLNKDITFDIESVSTLIFKENTDKILIYAGIKGDNEDFITEHYYLYDTKENSIDLIKKWESKILKNTRTTWRNYSLSKRDPQGFHFAKNSNFLVLPKGIKIDGYDEDINLLIDYKNNVHFINQDKKSIDIFKGDV